MTTPGPARTLPDDGIIDPVAVQIAVSGTRPVALTLPDDGSKSSAAGSRPATRPRGHAPPPASPDRDQEATP